MKKLLLLLLVLGLFAGCNVSEKDERSADALNDSVDEIQDQDLNKSEDVDDQDLDGDMNDEIDGITGFKDGLVSFDDEWNVYTNTEWGYALKVPKRADIFNCDPNVDEVAPVTVLKEGSKSFVTFEYKYDFANDCAKEDVTSIPKDGGSWVINSAKVSGDAELLAFIKDQYGDDCTITNVVDGDISIGTTDPDGGCFINYITFPKYDALAGLVHVFDIGQDASFYYGDGAFDMEMAQSFTFLK